MVPSASDIVRRRLTVVTVLRLLAVGVAHVALIPSTIVTVEYIDGMRFTSYHDWVPFVVAISFILGAAFIVWCLAPLAARLMIRVPRVTVCPNCRFKLDHLMSPQCVECGYTLTPEFMQTNTEKREHIREPDTVLLRQIASLIIRLAAGVFVPISAVSCFVMVMQAIEYPEWNHWTPAFAWAFVGLFALTLTLFASHVAMLIVPRRKRFGGNDAPATTRTTGSTDPGQTPGSAPQHA